MDTDTLHRGTLTNVEWKAAPDGTPTGEFTADFVTKHVADRYNEITLDGFIGEQQVMLLHQHDPTEILGRGRTYETDDKVRFEGRYNMSDPVAARRFQQHYEVRDLMETSYGFIVHPGGRRTEQVENDAGDLETRIYLQPLADGSPGALVKEVSTVVFAAGIDTGTVSLKSIKFTDQISEALAAVEAVVTRGEALAATRGSEGRRIGSESLTRLGELSARLADLYAAQTAPAPPTVDELALIAARLHLHL